MYRIHYVEIENFKTFAKKIRIDLEHPAVLIGPNNSGKTSVIQAISLWSRGVKAWYEKRGDPQNKEGRERLSAGINRLNILDVPVAETRFLWTGTHAMRAKTFVKIVINVGIEYKDRVRDCRLIFTYRDPEVIYCKPDTETAEDDGFIRYAAGLQFFLLYPMSGIMSNISADTEETPLTDGRINLLLGQGQTAQVLRNICYKVIEQDDHHHSEDWEKISAIMRRIFLVELHRPVFNETRGSLMMTYRQDGLENDLDISLAGRGLQQVLLILAFLYWHKGSVIMIDEPDAHLEILRQKQIYAILNAAALENRGQVIIATHSEAILDEAVDTNLTLLLQGEAVNLAKQQEIKHSLRTYGIEHYYKARVHPRILYIEGSTDIEILKALARRTKNEAAERVLTGRLNVYYTRNIEPENTLDNQLDRIGGAFGNYTAHFNALKSFIPGLRALAIFDSDNTPRKNRIEDQFAVLYWKNYEVENCFLSPQVLVDYAASVFRDEAETLFEAEHMANFKETVDEILLEDVFGGDKAQLNDYAKLGPGLKRTLLQTIKMSLFAEKVFKRYAEKYSRQVLLHKGEFYRLVPFCPRGEIPDEVPEKLDMLVRYLAYLPD
jgi:Fe-S cluster assembly ATPase SufC